MSEDILQPIISTAILPALDLLPRRMDDPRARILLLAIGLQESALKHRRQLVGGQPVGRGVGLWQFEEGGGCVGVLTHGASRDLMRWVCAARRVQPLPAPLWAALQQDDVLAAAAARLLLYTDPAPLPSLADPGAAWEYYERVWRPGDPRPAAWLTNWGRARAAIESAALA